MDKKTPHNIKVYFYHRLCNIENFEGPKNDMSPTCRDHLCTHTRITIARTEVL